MLPFDYDQQGNFDALGLSVYSEWLTGEQVRMMTFAVRIARRGPNAELKRPLHFIEISPYWMRPMSYYDYREIYRLLGDYGYDIYDKQFRRVEVTF